MSARTVHRVGEGEVRVGEFGEDIVRRLGHIPGGGQQPLLCVGERMGPAALDVIKIPAEKLQLRLFSIEALQCLVGNGEDLRGLKGGGPAEGHIQGHSLADHGLVGVHPGVLVALALGIVQ